MIIVEDSRCLCQPVVSVTGHRIGFVWSVICLVWCMACTQGTQDWAIARMRIGILLRMQESPQSIKRTLVVVVRPCVSSGRRNEIAPKFVSPRLRSEVIVSPGFNAEDGHRTSIRIVIYTLIAESNIPSVPRREPSGQTQSIGELKMYILLI